MFGGQPDIRSKAVKIKKNKIPFAFVIPAGAIYVVLLVVPIIMAFGFSFTKWNGISGMEFIGFDNYIKMFSDGRLGNAAQNTLLVTVVVVVTVNVLGLFLAMLLNKKGAKSNFFRATFFIPIVLSTVAVSFIWKSILSYTGVLNGMLESLGLTDLIVNSLGSRASALACICIVEIWRYLGYHMVLYLAALQTVPQELYEACTVDGGNAWNKFKSVTLPLIVPGATVSVIMSIINELRIYDVIKILTDGGPGYDTESLVYNIVAQGFGANRMGYACAIAVILFLVIGTISVFLVKRSNKLEVKQ